MIRNTRNNIAVCPGNSHSKKNCSQVEYETSMLKSILLYSEDPIFLSLNSSALSILRRIERLSGIERVQVAELTQKLLSTSEKFKSAILRHKMLLSKECFSSLEPEEKDELTDLNSAAATLIEGHTQQIIDTYFRQYQPIYNNKLIQINYSADNILEDADIIFGMLDPSKKTFNKYDFINFSTVNYFAEFSRILTSKSILCFDNTTDIGLDSVALNAAYLKNNLKILEIPAITNYEFNQVFYLRDVLKEPLEKFRINLWNLKSELDIVQFDRMSEEALQYVADLVLASVEINNRIETDRNIQKIMNSKGKGNKKYKSSPYTLYLTLLPNHSHLAPENMLNLLSQEHANALRANQYYQEWQRKYEKNNRVSLAFIYSSERF